MQEREEMFAKEVLTIKDFEKLFSCKATTAGKIMREIKAKNDRLKVSGIVHIQDYIEYFKLPQARYVAKKKEKTVAVGALTV